MITGSGGLLSADDSVAHQAGLAAWLQISRGCGRVGNNDAFFAASQKKVVCVLFFPRTPVRAPVRGERFFVARRPHGHGSVS
jgi:hypothetical protein